MTITPDDDRLRVPSPPDPSLRDCVTFSFGDAAAKLYGLVRASRGGNEPPSYLAVLYAGNERVAASAGPVTPTGEGWESVTQASIGVAMLESPAAWNVTYESRSGGLDLRFEVCSAPAVLDEQAPVAQAGGMQGYEQLCRVTGTATFGGRTQKLRCLGQRGQLWGKADWSRIELARTVSAWLGEDRGLTLTAVRPSKSKGHLDELLSGFVFTNGEPVPVADPRLSTTYDGECRQRRAGLELWMQEHGEAEHEYALRAAGEVLCATTLHLGEQRLESAFFEWRMAGRTGVGRYDVLRSTTPARGRKR